MNYLTLYECHLTAYLYGPGGVFCHLLRVSITCDEESCEAFLMVNLRNFRQLN